MIVVAGGSGFVGSHFVSLLKASRRPYVCISRPLLGDSQSLQKQLEGAHTLVHILGKTNGTDEALKQSNVEITKNLVKAAQAAGVKRLIYVSSVAAIRRHGLYGQTKFEAEEIIGASGIPYLIFRPAYIFGRGDRQNTEMMIRTLKQFPVIPLLGGGDFKLQPVYVEDVTRLLFQALDSSDLNKVYTVAGSRQISLKDMLLILSKELRVRRLLIPVPLKPVQMAVRVYASVVKNSKLPVKQILELNKHEAFDISETQRDFGFSPVTFQVGVQKMFLKKETTSCAA